MTTRVFIPQVPQHWDAAAGRMVTKFDTFDKAEEFGKLVTLLDRNDDVWNPDQTIAKLRRRMEGFDGNDFILPMGSYHFMIWTFMVAAELTPSHIQSLQWHQREQRYRVITTKVR